MRANCNLVVKGGKRWHDCVMDVLRKPLLNDDARREAFFEALPELYLGELLNELKHHRYFAESRVSTLERYDLLVSRGSFAFEQDTYRQAYDEFKSSFEGLKTFLETNLFTEDNKVILQPILKSTKPSHYKKLTKELDDLSDEVANKYKRVVDVFSKDKIPTDPNTTTSRSGNVLRFDNHHSYTASSKRTKGMLYALWDKRVKVNKIKNAQWTNPENVAVSMGLINSTKDYAQSHWGKIDETRKSMNRNLEKNGIRFEIRKNQAKKLLFVEV